jgi:hypothetical protein
MGAGQGGSAGCMHTTMLASCFLNTASHCVLLLLSLARTPPPGSWCIIIATRTLGLMMVQWLGPWDCLSHLVSWYIAIAIAIANAIGNTEESYSPQPAVHGHNTGYHAAVYHHDPHYHT